VAAKYLARKGADTLGIVGAGVQGRFNLLAIREVMPDLKLVKYFDISAEILKATVKKMNDTLPFQVIGCQSVQEVIEGSDVIVTATGKLEKVIYLKNGQTGALVLPVHHRGGKSGHSKSG